METTPQRPIHGIGTNNFERIAIGAIYGKNAYGGWSFGNKLNAVMAKLLGFTMQPLPATVVGPYGLWAKGTWEDKVHL